MATWLNPSSSMALSLADSSPRRRPFRAIRRRQVRQQARMRVRGSRGSSGVPGCLQDLRGGVGVRAPRTPRAPSPGVALDVQGRDVRALLRPACRRRELRQDPPVDVLAQRLRAQLLSGPPATRVVDVVEHLLAVQAQDLVGARLSVRARSTGLTAAGVDRALHERELVVSWLNRGTLHLVRSEDFPWLHALTTPQLANGNRTRLRQEGVDEAQAEQAVDVIRHRLTEGPATRAELRTELLAAGLPVGGQAVPHLLLLATLRSVCVRGPVVGREQA